MGKILRGLGYTALAAGASALAFGAGLYKIFWSTKTRRTFTGLVLGSAVVLTQCGDELKTGYNKVVEYKEMRDSLITLDGNRVKQDSTNKLMNRELTEIKYFANKRVDSLKNVLDEQSEKITMQSNTIENLNIEKNAQKDMYSKNIETIMNQGVNQEKKLDSLYTKLEYLIENKAPVNEQQKVYESIQLFK